MPNVILLIIIFKTKEVHVHATSESKCDLLKFSPYFLFQLRKQQLPCYYRMAQMQQPAVQVVKVPWHLGHVKASWT